MTDRPMLRRAMSATLLAAPLTFAALAPAPAHAETVLKVVKHSSLRVLDPILTTAYMSRNHGYMVFDTLFALNEEFEPQPQMVDTYEISDDKLTYTFTLRDGLKWHDGAPVTSADCIASIERWGSVDSMGQKMMDFVAEMKAVDEKTFRIVMKEPYGLVIESLAKVSSNVPFMMPKRLAETPGKQPIPEQIGSGPFKFVQAEFQPGVKAVYVKNEDYVPRKEAPSWASGGKVVKVDRVEWIAISDHMTAVNALINGEIDYMESPPHDLLPILKSAPGVKVDVLNKLGLQGMLRFNHLHPPFDNVKVRQAVAMAVNQEDFMKSWVGNPEYYKTCMAMFICDTPLATTAGADGYMQGNIEKAKALLKEAGYDGTPVVVMQPTDVASLASYPIVAAQAMRKAGLTVDLQAMDWQTLVGRRAKQDPVADGGWNMFNTNWASVDVLNPIMTAGLNAKGRDGGWFGWVEDAKLEELRDQFARETDPEKQKQIAADVQARAYAIMTHLPLGQYTQPTARRDYLSGEIVSPAPLFWNIEINKK